MSDLTHALDTLKASYPHDVQLSDGSEANLRLCSRDDFDAILAFARALETPPRGQIR